MSLFTNATAFLSARLLTLRDDRGMSTIEYST